MYMTRELGFHLILKQNVLRGFKNSKDETAS